METNVLYLDFMDENGKRRSLSIEDPQEYLTESEVSEAMDSIIAADIFVDKLTVKEGARIVTRIVDELEI